MEKAFVDVTTRWFNVKLPLVQRSLKELATFAVTKEELDDLYTEAQQLVDEEAATMERDKRGWYMQQFHNRGTVTDRIAAAAVKLTDNDFMFHMDCFGQLFEIAKGDAHYFEQALHALGALWPKILPSRPLKRFAAQHFATLPPKEMVFERKRVLAYWYIEDSLKRTFSQFLALLETGLKDRLLARRECWLDTAGKLLNTVAEGRTALIQAIVDKLGDPTKTVAHKAYHKLLDMLCKSSQNQGALLTELEKVIFMKNCPLSTQRYAVNVMNQLVFNRDGRALAARCVAAYLSLFRQLVIDGNIDQDVTSAIVVGLRRAFPYAGTDRSALDEHLNALFILAHAGSFSQQVSTMAMLQQVLAHGSKQMEARWYRALYAMLLASPKQLPHSSQLTGFFNLLYKAVRGDSNVQRVAAFVHRLLQRCLFHGEAFVCAVLLLVSDVLKSHPPLRELIRPTRGDKSGALAKAKKGSKADSTVATAPPVQQQQQQQSTRYDFLRRDPEFANACSECAWVLTLLSRHSHPSVVRLAVLLTLGEELVFESHPLDGMTLSNFLELFVEAKDKDKGRDAPGATTGVPVFRRSVASVDVPSAADPTFIYATPDTVDVATMFLHRYAVQRQRFYEQQQRKETAFAELMTDEEVAAKLRGSSSKILFGLEMGVEMEKRKKAAEAAAAVAAAGAPAGEDDAEVDAAAVASSSDDEVGDDDPFDDDVDSDGEGAKLRGVDWGDSDDDGGSDPGYGDLDEEDDDEDDDVEEDEDEDANNEDLSDGGAEDAAEGFDAIMAKHKQPKSKRQVKSEQWLEERSFDQRREGRGRGARGGFGAHHQFGARGARGRGGGGQGFTGHVRPRDDGRGGRGSWAPPSRPFQRKRY